MPDRADAVALLEEWVDNPNLRVTRLPRTWTFANRLQWGLNSVLASLGATGDWGGMFRAAVERPLVLPSEAS